MKIGDAVTWTSQSQGCETTKAGIIIAEVPAGHSAMEYVPATAKRSHIKFQNVSENERTLVQVPAGRDGRIAHYYCPRRSALKAKEAREVKRWEE